MGSDAEILVTHTDRTVQAISALGVVPIPGPGPTYDELRRALVTISGRRDRLATLMARITMRAREAKNRLVNAEAALRIRVDELLVNDAEVRSARAVEQLSRARIKAAVEGREVLAAELDRQLWDGMVDVCSMAEKNLQIAKEQVSKLVQIAELEAAGHGLGWSGAGRRKN